MYSARTVRRYESTIHVRVLYLLTCVYNVLESTFVHATLKKYESTKVPSKVQYVYVVRVPVHGWAILFSKGTVQYLGFHFPRLSVRVRVLYVYACARLHLGNPLRYFF